MMPQVASYSGNGATAVAPVPQNEPLLPQGPVPGVPFPTAGQITKLHDAHELYATALHARMERDWDQLILREYDAGEGYRSYTSNEPMTYFNKHVSFLTMATIKPRIPVEKAKKEKRTLSSGKERFISGILKANDERLLRMGELPLQTQLATYIDIRGWFCGRALLVKDPVTGETYGDITPWDPLHVSWGMGPKGLKWICYKTKKTHSQLAGEYPDTLPELVGANGYFDSPSMDESTGLDVYEWWDEWHNIVVVNDKYAKPPTPHGAVNGRGKPVVPSFFGAVGPLPLIRSSGMTGQNNLVHQGESIFAPNRAIYDKVNLVLSTMLQLVALSRDQSRVLYSRDGTKTLESNPSLEGSVVPLVFGEDKLDVIQLLEMSKDTGVFLGIIAGEIQRGAIPYSAYGQLAFQLSGYAVNLLKQAMDAPIVPRTQAMESAFWQIGNLLSDQFASGAFPAMQLQGYRSNRSWFDEEFGPEMMKTRDGMGLPSLEFKMVVKTPQDDLARLQMAKLADTPDAAGNPLLPRTVIWDEHLDLQDVDSIEDAINEQRAKTLLPVAMLWNLMVSAERRGDRQTAQFYIVELVKQGLPIEFLQSLNPDFLGFPNSGLGPTGDANGGNQSSGRPGYSPETAPGPMQGAPRPGATPQSGANVPPGSPRPGAVAPVVQAWGPT